MNLITVRKAFNPAEADVVRSRLEAAGFQVMLAHDLAATSIDGYTLGVGGILVQVPEGQVEEARELLLSSEAPPPPDSLGESPAS